MKITKILILVLLFILPILGQGSTTTPYDTSGWDSPEEFTDYYKLAIYTLLSNPGGWVNRNTAMIDSLLNELIIFIDTRYFEIVNDTLRSKSSFSITLSDTNATTKSYQGSLNASETADTVVVQGVDSVDVVIASARETNPQEYLWAIVKPDTIIVNRPSGIVSDQKYNWIWIKKYD